ncbi:putative methyltransferase C9orf114 isoform X2 [Camellia sinensis]|uniref:putative methyltransferase C9orf114 isoform X2 n=1 Tax=Camellia sinensis TaxID=4442 RepID=UPI001036BBAB|nr:putative methyltransferase C9orf114 isoform X2 [Camellia sinensis]
MAKKKKRAEAEAVEAQTEAPNAETELELVNGDSHDTKQKKNKKKKRKRENEKDHVQPKEIPTVSIAVPGSIIDNAQSLELATRLAGQIARAATIFRIDEGLLPPLDAPHHLRKHEWAPYREGVTLKEQAPNFASTLVDVGLSKNVLIDTVIEPGVRVTVAMGTNRNLDADLPRQVVSSSQPREELGMYWGYKVRHASSISSVFNDSPYKGGYDHLIGTSEHGLFSKSSELTVPSFRHLLIAFGGLAGLEESIEEDNNLKGKNAQEIFDSYLNTCPNQGSRTIRTEEAIFISLQYFQEPINRALQRFEHQN